MSEVTRGLSGIASGGLSEIIPGVGDAIGNFDLQNALGMANRYQTALDPAQQRQLAAAIAQSSGNLQNIYGQQNQLAQMFQNQAQGMGPNPAQIMLNQATNRNIAQAAGQIGGVKGINPALAGRLLSQQAGMANQQAAGQGALMGAQQQLQAQNALSQLYGNMGQQQAQGISAMGGVLNPTQQINAAVSQGNQTANQQLAGSLMNAGASALMANKGGMIPHMSNGGSPGDFAAAMSAQATDVGGPETKAGFKKMGGNPMSEGINNSLTGVLRLNEGGKVPASKVGKFLSGIFDDAPAMNCGGTVNMKSGGEVPGEANVPGDSIKNDTVPAMLSPDEIVIPRSIILGPNPAKMAALFVQRELDKKKKAK